MTTIPFSNWTKGELARELQARIDTSQYSAAARKVRNFIVQRYGGLSYRPGFRLVAEVDDATKDERYVPFQYNLEQSYIISMQDQQARFLALGGAIVETNLKITAITKETNPTVTVAYHDYVVGDRIFFSGIVGMAQLNGRSALVTSVTNANNFKISINTSGFTTFVSSDGEVRVAAPTPPAPPAPLPPTPPPPADPPPVGGGGGSGGGTGELPGWTPEFGSSGGRQEF